MARKGQSRAARRDAAVAEFRRVWDKAQDVLSELTSAKDNLHSELSDLKDEIEQWRDNMPENLQGSDKYQTLDSTCDALESAMDALDNLELDSIESSVEDALSEAENAEFPGMR